MDLGWIVFFEAALINIFLMALLMAAPSIGILGTLFGATILIVATIILVSIAKSVTKPSSVRSV